MAPPGGGPGLRTRITFAVGGATAVLGAMVLLLAPVIGELRDELAYRRRVIDVAEDDVSSLLAATIDQETGQRGFLITGRPEFLLPYQTGQRQAAADLADLSALAVEIEGLDSVVADVESALAGWQDTAEPEIQQRRDTGEVPTASVLRGDGRRRFDALRAEVARLGDILDDEGRQTRDDIDASLQRLVVTMLVTYFAGVTVCFAVWYLLGRWITRPVQELVASVERVEAGEFDHVIEVQGPSELVAVATATDSMRQEIVDRLSEATRARQALDQRAPAVVALREELEPAVPDLPPGMDLDICFEPQLGVLAGDFAEVLRLDDHRIAVVVADASGHGAPVVVRALRVKHLIGAALAGGMGPAEALELIAPRVGGTGEGWFVSAFILVAADDGAITWAGAGHPGALVRAADGGLIELPSTGPVLGPVPGPWGEETITPTMPWVAVVVTDGFLEARNAQREFLGDEPIRRRLAVLDPRAEGAASALVNSLRDDVVRFIGDADPDDDLTVVAVQVTHPVPRTVDLRGPVPPLDDDLATPTEV